MSHNNIHMGYLVDQMAQELKIARDMQDQFSFESHQKAVKAQEKGKFDTEIIPIEIVDSKGIKSKLLTGEHPRKDTNLKVLSSLKPAFLPNGSITAGNASGINDGAAILILSSIDLEQTFQKPHH